MVKVKNVVIAHCYGCEPSSHWFPWFKKELEKEGVKVFVPDFGQEEVPSFEKWSSVLMSVLDGLKSSETVLIGHSLGGALIPRVLTGWKGEPFLAVFLVAAPFDDLGWPTLMPFFKKGVIGSDVSDKAGKFFIINSDNDPFVPLEHGRKYQGVIGGEVIVEHGMEHLWQEEYGRLKEMVIELRT